MNLRLFRNLDYTFGWLAFAIATTVYMLTLAPSLSFWDCGEFISASYKLEVGHPPGAPLYLMISRFFALFASSPEQVAYMVNSVSAVASGLTIAFLYWTIAYFVRRILIPKNEYTLGNTIAVIAASMIGAMAYTFSDTFWFSAVEAEVYGMSSLFTAMVFWAILKWSDNSRSNSSLRWIILIALLVGLSIGVHLLNLLAIPAMVFVYYFSKYKPNIKGVTVAVAISLFTIAAIMWGIIPGVAKVAAQFELLFVNKFGMSFNSGVIAWIIVTIASLVASIYFTQFKYNKIAAFASSSIAFILVGVPFMSSSIVLSLILIAVISIGVYLLAQRKAAVLNLIMICTTMIIVGYSTFAMIVIRSNANPPMDQNSPDNVFNLLYYLNREQYGDRPLFYGQYYYSEPTKVEQGSPVWVKHGDKYEIVDRKPVYKYPDQHCTFLPRMHSSNPEHIEAYESWGGLREGQRPKFKHNLSFMFNYQIGWMYMRYFMWNFAGRQNDIQGHGNLIHGNWKSGISFIDNPRLGDQSKLPDYLKNNKANNKYYMLPLILGILGLIVHFSRHKQDAWIVTFLFILTGLAIVIYLNQTPHQPRERDYAYAGSFYAFAIWIGLGVLFLYDLLKRFLPQVTGAIIALILSFPIPYIMASENWDDHDRSNRYVAHDFAANYLNSCEPNAILFTYGDNDTFPIWYAQEVEGIRTDVKVCCLPYFASDWYIDQMKMASYESGPMPLTLERRSYEPGARDISYHYRFDEEKGYLPVDSLMKFVADDRYSLMDTRDQKFYIYPHNKLYLKTDSAKLVESGMVKPQYAHLIETELKWNLNRKYLLKNELLTLDMLAANDWNRPVYFTSIGSTNTLNLDEYFMLEGFAYRLVPYNTGTKEGLIDTEVLYDRYMNAMKWGNLNDPSVYIDHTIERTTKILRIRRNFARLAVQLNNEAIQFEKEGDSLKADDYKQKAKDVMDRVVEVMPYELFPMNYFDIDFAEAFYSIGDSIKGDEALLEIARVSHQELDFFFYTLNDKQVNKVVIEIQMAMATISRVINATIRNEREEIYMELMQKFEAYNNAFDRLRI